MRDDIREQVRKKYAKAIKSKTGCCNLAGCCGGSQDATNAITANLYENTEFDGLSQNLLATSLGCGNPTALGNLYAGETVLDLGSGAGLDVLLSAKRVGPFGKAYGLDMTDEMLAEASANKQKSGLANVEFLKGHIEDIPLPDETVDVVISNCVINLSADKDQVFREIHRVLKPGGRIAISDIVTTKPMPEGIRKSLLAWAGCVAGALTADEYKTKLAQAGLQDIEIIVTRVYDLNSLNGQNIVPEATIEEISELNGSLVSAFIRAKKGARRLRPGTDFTVKQAGAEDFPAIKDLLGRSGLTTAGVELGRGSYYIAWNNGLLGVLGVETYGTAVLLRSFAVEPRVRKTGVAGALVEHVLREAKAAGFLNAYLLTNTAEGYMVKHGFIRIERSQIPEDVLTSSALGCTCPASSICMSLKL